MRRGCFRSCRLQEIRNRWTERLPRSELEAWQHRELIGTLSIVNCIGGGSKNLSGEAAAVRSTASLGLPHRIWPSPWTQALGCDTDDFLPGPMAVRTTGRRA